MTAPRRAFWTHTILQTAADSPFQHCASGQGEATTLMAVLNRAGRVTGVISLRPLRVRSLEETRLGGEPLRRDISRIGLRRTRERRRGEFLLTGSVVVGFVVGLAITIGREAILSAQYHRDSTRIFNIASGKVPDFRDQSYTPVGIAYRWLGLGDSPDAAALVGYVLTSIIILVAVVRTGRRSASPLVAIYIVAAFVLSAVYLGQYSKDVFVLVPVLILLVLPRSIWWDLVSVATMLTYAYFFRDYWYLVAAAYVVCRIILIRQVRLRYLLLIGALGAVAVGMAFTLVRGVNPNHYRTAVQGHLDADTIIVPLEPFEQPLGGAVDIFLNYWLLYLPLLLPLTASAVYIVVAAGVAFAKLFPLLSTRSSVRWPRSDEREGALLRRALALILAFGAVQALFEPDYGSALRHFTPLMPLAIALVQATRAGVIRSEPARPWSWSGASQVKLDSNVSLRDR